MTENQDNYTSKEGTRQSPEAPQSQEPQPSQEGQVFSPEQPITPEQRAQAEQERAEAEQRQARAQIPDTSQIQPQTPQMITPKEPPVNPQDIRTIELLSGQITGNSSQFAARAVETLNQIKSNHP